MSFSTPLYLRRRRDWFNILRDLKKAGISYHEVARKTNHAIATVVHWAEHGDPKDADARIVLALYAQHCPEQFTAHQKLFEVTISTNGGASNPPTPTWNGDES